MLKLNLYIVVTLLYLLKSTDVTCKELSESERAARAAFVQRLLNKRKHLEGKIRLVGGSSEYEGNVYIYHAGRWGAVCDDSWDDAAARVVCGTFDKTGTATHGGQYGEATRKFWMDDVVCEGSEKSISECIFTGWGSSDCQSSEAAGVICTDRTKEDLIKTIKPAKRIHEVLDINSASLRLAGGRSNNEGRVEIYHKGNWGSLCPDGWTLFEASVVCRHLALGFAQQALQTDYFGSSTIVLSGVQCQGNESNLFYCEHQEYREVVCPGEKGYVAAVTAPIN
ncbi:hypothetical protein ACJJTC_014188 [Scirpophaga incertulas]